MDRKKLILYLQNVRDLELERVVLERQCLQKKQEGMDIESQFQEGYQKLSEKLNKLYSENLLPMEYRGRLSVIQYLYEKMSTTQLSYSEILNMARENELMQHLEKLKGLIS